MPNSCNVYKCSNKGGQLDENGQKIRFFAIPAVLNRDDERGITQERRYAWIEAIKRTHTKPWSPTKSAHVCSVHFHKGQPAYRFNRQDPDWIPSLKMPHRNKSMASSSKRQSVQRTEHLNQRKKPKIERESIAAVYMKESTHIRWKKVKETLSLESDDALAAYFLNRFEDNNQPSKAVPMSTTAQSKRYIRIVPRQKSASQSPALYMKTKSGSMLPVSVVSVEREKATQLTANTSNNKVKQEKVQEVTDDDMEATTASDSATGGEPDDIVDIPLTQPVIIKTEKPDDHYESKINASKSTSPRNLHSAVSKSELDSALLEIKNAVAQTSSRPPRKAKLAAKLSLEHHLMNDEQGQDSLQHSSSDDDEDTGSEISQPRKYLCRSPKLNREKTSSKYYQCSKCEVIATEPQTLETHKLEVHGAVDILKCPHCCITYNYNASLKRHIARVHPDPGQEAEQLSDDEEEMRKEAMLNLKNGSKYTCKFCPRDFRNIRTWWDHQREMHVENPDGTVTHKGYACQKCNYVFKSLRAMSIHVKQCDGCRKALASELSCPKCQKSFDDTKVLKEHLKNVHSEEVSDLGTIHVESGEANEQSFSVCVHGSKILCKSKKAPSSDTTELQRLQCPQCDKTFKTKAGLKEHTYNIHSEVKQEYKCKFCPRVYSCNRSLRHHQKIHTVGQETFKCRYCPKSYMTKNGWRDHELKHKGIKSLCNVCGKTFATPKVLYSHMRLHKGVKKFQWLRCNLKWHENSHTGEKPYTCRYCDKGFALTTARLVHEKTQHRAQYWADRAKAEAAKQEKSKTTYTCRYCDKCFSLTTARLDHEKKQHLSQYWADCAKSEAAELEKVLKSTATESVSESRPQREAQKDPTLVTQQESHQQRPPQEHPTVVTQQGSDQQRHTQEDPTLITPRGYDQQRLAQKDPTLVTPKGSYQQRQAQEHPTVVTQQGYDQQRLAQKDPTLVTPQGYDQQRLAQKDPTLVTPQGYDQQRQAQKDPTLITPRGYDQQRLAQKDPTLVTPQGYDQQRQAQKDTTLITQHQGSDQLDPVVFGLHCLSQGLEADGVAGQSFPTN